MPNRIIREGWIDSERINLLNAEAEIFFLRLCLKADDFGRYTANVQLLKSTLFPLRSDVRNTDISRNLAAAQEAGLIRCYEVAGKRYLLIPEFRQRTRASESKFPPPQEGDGPTSDSRPPPDGQMTFMCQSSAHVVGDEVGGECEVGARAREASSIPDRQQAIAQTAVSGIDPAFAGIVFDQWCLRDGKDGAGIPVKWLGYCTHRWNKERAEWLAGTHKACPKDGEGRPPRPSNNHAWRDGRWQLMGPNI